MPTFAEYLTSKSPKPRKRVANPARAKRLVRRAMAPALRRARARRVEAMRNRVNVTVNVNNNGERTTTVTPHVS